MSKELKGFMKTRWKQTQNTSKDTEIIKNILDNNFGIKKEYYQNFYKVQQRSSSIGMSWQENKISKLDNSPTDKIQTEKQK